MLLSFGPFELDVSSCELRRDGRVVPLQPRIFDTIRYLAENPERLIEKQELIDALWGGQQLSYVVVPWSISHARKALGETAGGKRFIETVRGRGYRFSVAVRVSGTAEASEATEHEDTLPATVEATELFLGRDAIVEQLLSSLTRASAAHGGMHLLVGEPGIGKTRCASELASVARKRGMSVWTGHCLDGGITPPFWPFIQVLRELTWDATVPRAERREAEVLVEALVPAQSKKSAASSRSSGDGNESRFWLLDKLGNCLVQAAKSRTRVVCWTTYIGRIRARCKRSRCLHRGSAQRACCCSRPRGTRASRV